MEKQCTKCKKVLPIEDNFTKTTKRLRNGRVYEYWRSHCQSCRAVQCKTWRKSNSEKIQKYYVEVDKPKCTRRARTYRERHPGRQCEITKRYRQTPRGTLQHRQANKLRFHRQRSMLGKFTSEQLMARFAFYGGRCWICGKPATTIDHVIPISKGGTNWPANLRPACRTCNARKGNRWFPLITEADRSATTILLPDEY